LFVLHRLVGKRLNWRLGGAVAAVAGAFAVGLVIVQTQDPRQWNQAGPDSGEAYFFPSLARTATGDFIPAESLMNDEYCAECHGDTHEQWAHSVHRFASFNNPAYLFSVRNTRAFALERDGNVQAARFCAGCHDLVPFFSGAFDDPDFDDVNHPTSQAGITCSGCHAITHVNSVRGNADYTIEEPLHYPFAFSESPALRWVNRLLVKANPAFHKRTFLKPLHQTPEFCGSCHKVHLPEALNGYKWLRGQNHYDTYHLSGVSGHGITSFYYPPAAQDNCNGCHMKGMPSEDFGAEIVDGESVIKGHQFPSANTAIPHLLGMPEWVNDAQRDMLEGALRVDIFGLRADGRIDGELLAPLRPSLPALEPGGRYRVEVVLRTLTLGHPFTQGTADSNEVWVEFTASTADVVFAESGARDPVDGAVDRWAHFVNSYVIDRDGNRIDRRNAEDIAVALYNNQIPPGGADVVHYVLDVPEDAGATITLEAALHYRKFDTTYLRLFEGETFDGNDLPVTTIAADRIVLPVAGAEPATPVQAREDIPEWQRWNDYGIGLLRKRGAGQLRQAEEAFGAVERAGRGDGPLNLARVYLREGRLEDASTALGRAAAAEPAAYPWSVAYFTARVNAENGFFDEAIEGFQALVETRFNEARERGFDFGQDYRLLNMLAETLYQRSRTRRPGSEQAIGDQERALTLYESALSLDPENATAHYGAAQVLAALGREEEAAARRADYARYRPDDNARDRAIAAARRKDPAADRAADPVVLYELRAPRMDATPVARAAIPSP
ncbi:MAG: tetratricopeptide repeat protein, partial [Pseudomonadota bacterium]